MPLQIGKIPIVVPRQKKYEEHVNDHQLEFCKAVEERMRNILLVEEIGELDEQIKKYKDLTSNLRQKMNSNNSRFNEKLENIVENLLKK